MSWLNDNFISRFFVTVIGWFYSLTGSYLVSVILFTLAIKLLLLPLDLKQRKAMAKQTALSAKVQEIQRRYKNDPRLAQQKVQEYYKKSGVKMSSGCLPLLLQLPVLFAMFGAISILSNTETVKLVAGLASGQDLLPPTALWVHNLWRPDTGTASIMPSPSEFATILSQSVSKLPADIVAQAQATLTNAQINQLALASAKLPAGTFFAGMVNSSLATIPAETVTAAVSSNYTTAIAPVLARYAGLSNGYFIFPILAGVSSFFVSHMQKKQAERTNPGQANGMGGMQYIMPIFSIWWTSTTGVCFAIYWLVSNLFSIAQVPLLDWIARKELAKENQKALKAK